MTRGTIEQTSFAGGEVSPRLYGRTDIAKYASAAEKIENFIPRPEGGLMRRHGTRYGGNVKTAGKLTRVVPFIFSTVQAYIIEFGDTYIRFWKDYGQIVSGPPVELVSPYLEADLPNLAFAQSADTLFIVHPNYPPATLTRTSHTTWFLNVTVFANGPFASENTDPAAQVVANTNIAGGGYNVGQNVALQANQAIFAAGHVGSYFYMSEVLLDQLNVAPWISGTATGGIGTQVSNAGNVYEQSRAGAGSANGLDPPVHTEGEFPDSSLQTLQSYKVWRYLHSRWAIVKITGFVDSKNVTGVVQTYLCNGLDQKGTQSNPITAVSNVGGLFRVTSNGHGFSNGSQVNVAGVVGTGGMTAAINGDWKIINVTTTTFDLVGSTFVGAFTSAGLTFRYATWRWRHGAFSAARGYPAAVTLHEQRLVFANTVTQPFGVWTSRAGDYSRFLPGVADDDAITYNIASSQVNAIRWLSTGPNLLMGALAQEFAAYGGGLGDPITPQNTRIVPQSNEGSNQCDPANVGTEVVFVNRSGRKVFSLIYDLNVNGYAATDLTELADHLTLGVTIVAIAWAKNPASLLWALRSDGVLLSLTYRRDQQIFAWARHPMPADCFIESIAVIPSSPGGEVDDLWMAVRRTVNGATVRYVEYLALPFEPTSPTDKVAMGFVDAALQYSGVAATVISGLGHLEAKTIKVVATLATGGAGVFMGDFVVSGGAVTLPQQITQGWFGLGYVSRLRLLRPVATDGKTKRIARTTVRCLNSMGGACGPADESTMEDLIQRDLANPMDASPPLASGDFEVHAATDYDLAGQVAVVQNDPLPLDILSIMHVIQVSEG